MGVEIADILKFELNRAIMNELEVNPRARLLNLDELSDDVIKEYLRSLHTILWRDWNIISDDGMEKAVQFIKTLFDQIYATKAGTRTVI